jgi:hypothetical protein
MQVVKLIIVAIFVALACAPAVHASTNIPIDSPFYTNLDALVSKGLIKSNLSSTEPFTRAEAGRLLAEAIDRTGKEEISSSSANLLDRMSQEYKDEISEIRVPGSTSKTFIKPLDEFSISYNFLNGPYSVFNNEGIDYYDGQNVIAQFQARGRLWNVFSFYIQPMFLYNQKLKNIDGNDDTEFRLHKGYVTFSVDNFELEVGKDSIWWGPGYHGALLISNNARPFEMIKISNPRTTLLPWIFRYLGPFRYTLLYSTLADKGISEHPPNSELFGARLDFKPHPLFEVGLSYLAHFGGDRPGIENLDLSDYLYILFSSGNRNGDKRDSNKEAAVDIALTIPNLAAILPVAHSLKLYAEWGGEDEATLPYKEAYLLGMIFNDIFLVQGLQLRAEYADLSPKSCPYAWYRHGWWAMKYHGRVFGHHAGTDSDDLFIELFQTLENKFSYKIGFDKERSGISESDTQEKYQYFFETGYDITKYLKLAVSYSYEEVNNYENGKDSKQKNHFMGIEFKCDF